MLPIPRRPAPPSRPPRRRRPLWTVAGGENSTGSSLRGLAALLALLPAACAPAGETPAPEAVACLPGAVARVEGRLYGSLEAPVDWREPALECEGMPRPGDGGLRLRFAQPIVPTEERLVIIIGIGGVDRDETAEGLPATLTIIDEHNDRFFSNAGDNCWADVLEQAPVAGRPASRAVRGRVYCSAALAAVTGAGSVSLTEIEFLGRVDWPAGDAGR